MLYGIDVGGIAIEALADHPAYFSVVVYPVAQKLCPAVEDKVSGHLLIGILELIMISPHVVPCSRDHILLHLRNVGSRAFLYTSSSYIRMGSKDAYRAARAPLLGKGGSTTYND